MHLPEMRIPEFLRRRENSPDTPQNIEFQPQQSNYNRFELDTGHVMDYYENHILVENPQLGDYQLAVPSQQYQKRPRRNVKETWKECRLNRGKCQNSFFVSFHKDDRENSLFSTKMNECSKNVEMKRKKRDVFKIEWVECGDFIVWAWIIFIIIVYVGIAVYLGILFF
uniref:Uncharacterized protein n=1 Tax=Meloidogyne javanica TaxID=6303 RepID=A0A915LC06_MELJA